MDTAHLEAKRLELAHRLELPSDYDNQRASERSTLFKDVNRYRVASIAIDGLHDHEKATAWCFQIAKQICEAEKWELSEYNKFKAGTFVLHQMVLMELCFLEFSSLSRYNCYVILLPHSLALGREETATKDWPFPFWTAPEDKYGNQLLAKPAYPTPDWMFTGAPPEDGEERLWHPSVREKFLVDLHGEQHSVFFGRPQYYKRKPLGPVEWVRAIDHIERNYYRINKEMLGLIHDLDETLPKGLVERVKAKKPKSKKAKKQKGKRYLFDALINRADQLVEYDWLHQRCHLDYRGRIFLSRSLLNYQGDDVSRCLFEFGDGIELNKDGHEALLLHAANLYEVKGPVKKRIKFARGKLKEWIEYASNPLENYGKWIVDDDGEALDDPLQFIRACMELRDATSPKRLIPKKGFITHLPVEVDQSNSVIQHLAALRRTDWSQEKQLDLARQSNLSAQADFYTGLAKHIRIKESLTDKQRRKLIKKMVVPRTYGAGAKKIEPQWDELGIEVISRLTTEKRIALIKECIDTLEEKVPALKEFREDAHALYDELRQRAKAEGKRSPPIRWSLPTGFVMELAPLMFDQWTQRVAHSKKQHDESGWHGHLELKARMYKDFIDVGKIIKAIQTAVIHSIDATVAHRVCAHAYFPIIAVHDAWACHANNIPKLRKLFVDTFTSIHEAEMPWFIIRRDVLGEELPSTTTTSGLLTPDLELQEQLREFYAVIQDFPDSIG